jgi:hypothetical protein
MWFITAALAAAAFTAPATTNTTVPDTAVPDITTPDTTVPETVPSPLPPTASFEFHRVTGADIGRPGDSYEWAGEITATGAPGSLVRLTVHTDVGWVQAGAGPTHTGTDGWACLTSPPPPPGQPPTAWYGVMCVADIGETGTITAGVSLHAVVSNNAANGVVLGVNAAVEVEGASTVAAADSIVVEHGASSPGVPLPGVTEQVPAAEPASAPEPAQVLPETGAARRAALLLSMAAAVSILAGGGCLAAARRPGRSLTD